MRAPLHHLFLSSVAFVLAAPSVTAQEPASITGVVATETGTPLEAANVFIESLSLGVLTDAQGRYVLIVPATVRPRTATVDVTASLIGHTTVVQTITLRPGTQVLDFILGEDPLRITGIRVTALGMERQSRELGIATQQLDGDELTRLQPNLVNTLSGRVAGVNVTSAGTQGGSSYIVVRGENSIAANNQPLFVVDGIPINNDLIGMGGIDWGNAAQDINPEDIESITVLKGPNAAALYGSRGANGVILIETKNGRDTRGGPEMVVSQQVTFEDELKLPDYQNSYGQGFNGQFAFRDGYGGGLYDEIDESWGPPLDWDPDGDGQVLMIPQWFSEYDESLPGCVPGSPLLEERLKCRVADPWVSHPYNVDNFLRNGVTSTTDVSVAASTESLNVRASFGRLDQEGMVPGHTQRRTSLRVAGGIRALERLSIDASGQYIRSEGENRPLVGGLSVMNGLYWFGRQIDTNRLEDLYDETRPPDEPLIGGFPYSWNTLYWVNPYFQQLVDHDDDTRNRLIGQISATYELTDWLSATARIGTDWIRNDQRLDLAANPQRGRPNGWFYHGGFDDQETNADFLITADRNTGLPFTSKFAFGGNRRDVNSSTDYMEVLGLSTPGTFDVSNAAVPPGYVTWISRKRVNSLFGQADFGYEDYLFLTVTGRNDWSSTLPEKNRSYFYPSVSGSFVFTELTDALPLSYGKLRASWAQVGNDTEPYSLRDTYEADPRRVWDGRQAFSLPGELPNRDLKPETTESWELGAEVAFLNNRLGLDVTYYTEETRNQIMRVPLSAATGRTSRLLNAGTVENEGWEMLVRVTPVVSEALRWESTLTWSRNSSRVSSLAPGVTAIATGGIEYVTLFAREGEPLGQIVADYDYQYARASGGGGRLSLTGKPIVGADGLPLSVVPSEPTVIGNVNPDWTAGWANEVTLGSVRLSFLFDWRQGGEVFSVTKMYGRYAGALAETAEGGRCSADGTPHEGYPVCDATTGIIADGVVETSPGVYEPNTTLVSQQDYWHSLETLPRAHLEDATYVKLRELTLTHRLPSSWTQGWGAEAVDLSLVGANLWMWTKAHHIDPETSIRLRRGVESGQMPTARSFGLRVAVRM